ncbi:MAG TPA: glutaredoxin domain-containing protein [Sedimentisphaerales bacterium]|nr:glutaredoxin domain-containing protein [Sedimentisphaerales bacterium]
MSAVIRLFGKPNCGLCEAAKAKLDLLGFAYVFRSLDDVEHWRDDEAGMTTAMAEYQMTDTLPVFLIDGAPMSYPRAMKALRERK